MRPVPFFATLSLAGVPLLAQPDSQATAARGHYREAVAAARASAWTRAAQRAGEAATAWPTQVAYLSAAARWSARATDTTSALRWLERLANLGLSIAVDQDSALSVLSRSVPSLRNSLVKNGAPLLASRPIRTDLPSDFYPEGVDYDPRNTSFIVASVRKRTLSWVTASGRARPFLPPGAKRLDAALAVRIDAARGRIWVTTRGLPAMEGFQASDTVVARVLVFDRRGRLLAAATAPNDGAPHWFGDLAIAPDGTAYLSDSESPILFQASLRGSQLNLVPMVRHRLFRSLQGLAFDHSGKRLYLADYSHGLLRVTPTTGLVEYLEPPPGSTLLGIDGLAYTKHAIIAIQNGVAPARVIRIDLDHSGRPSRVSTADRHLPIADEPTIGTIANGQFVYVANSQWEKYDDAGRLKADVQLEKPVLLVLPLSRP